MNAGNYIAHSATPAHPDGQGLVEHLRNVASIAAGFFAGPDDRSAGIAKIAGAVGLAHDAGKYAAAVQRHLRNCDGDRPVHATLGGQILAGRYGVLGRLIAFAVLGHHGGLPDGAGGEGRSLEVRLGDGRDAAAEQRFFAENALPEALSLPPLAYGPESMAFEASLLVRMLYSALVDADFLDTERYFQPEVAAMRDRAPDWQALTQRYARHMQSLLCSAADTPVNRARAGVLRQCRAAGRLPQGIFSLTVPTGGGKTLASLGFALEHRMAHPNIRRIVYAIPFTSIIEQNAEVFRAVLGDEAVLEHHSTVNFPDDEDTARLASENWDAPLVVTTNVQLFESLYAAGPARCRKVHNLQNSILLLDEAQALPDGMLRPCLQMLRSLVRNWNVTVVLMTATQPELSNVWPEETQVREIVDDVPGLFAALRRVEMGFLGGLSDAEMCARLRSDKRALCIVNSRRHAQKLYGLLAGEEGVFHLSALMCPKHRSRRLAEIRTRLQDRDMRCIVISTSLVEAGVDLDFPTVYRALSGLDSVAQAAGRCNRNGEMDALGRVFVFMPEDASAPVQTQKAGNDALQLVGLYDDLLAKPAMDHYFRMRFGHGADLDRADILPRIAEQKRGLFPFRAIARDFQMIQSAGEPLMIPLDGTARALLTELETARHPGAPLRKLRQYAVTIYPEQMRALTARGLVRTVGGVYVLDAAEGQLEQVYTQACGLVVDGDVRLAELFV